MPSTESPDENNTVRDMNSSRPFNKTARDYYRKGWLPMPLPAKLKFPPPTGFTGHNPKEIDEEQLDEWIDDEQHAKANIGLRMNEFDLGGESLMVVGIDIDDYSDGDDGKHKLGWSQYEDLVKRNGPLPPTWTSSSREDGKSGIRFFLAPVGLSWAGKASKDIDVIQTTHRYAVVYPSWHPKGGQYRWSLPGELPGAALPGPAPYLVRTKRVKTATGAIERRIVFDAPEGVAHDAFGGPDDEIEGPVYDKDLAAAGKIIGSSLIPNVADLPLLPEAWVEYLTRGRIPYTTAKIDMDSSADEVMLWAKRSYRKGKACKTTLHRYNHWIKQIEDDPSSHDKILGGHWQLMRMGLLEGHPGVRLKIQRLEKIWINNAVKRGKRGPEEAAAEIFRSTTMGLRKIKAEIEDAAARGIVLNGQKLKCTCYEEKPLADDADGPVPTGKARDPIDYEWNDDGNGEHMLDLYGDSLAYVPALDQWIHWNGERWARDTDGLARRCFRTVKVRQQNQVDQLYNAYLDAIANAGGDAKDPDAKLAGDKWKGWRDWAKQSGNNNRASGALEAATSFEGVSIGEETLDGNIHLLGFENGVMVLDDKGAHFRQATRDDLVTLSCGVDYMELSDQARAGDDLARGVRLWSDYLELFLPSGELRRFVQKVFGYCLLGRNTERLGVFLYGDTSTGKSTILNAVMAALGDYAAPVEMSIFKHKDLNPQLAQALPKRIVTTTEAGGGDALSAEIFKRITGNDPLTAELKGVNTIIRRVPSFTPVIATNAPPNIKGADKALSRRLLIIPFDTQVPKEKDQKQGSSELAEMGQMAVLAWMVEGWRMYAQEGLDREEWPNVVEETTTDFAHGLNDLGEFLADNVEVTDKAADIVAVREVYDAYVNWATVEQRIREQDQYTLAIFGKLMKEQGFSNKNKRINNRQAKVYLGIKLAERSGMLKFNNGGNK